MVLVGTLCVQVAKSLSVQAVWTAGAQCVEVHARVCQIPTCMVDLRHKPWPLAELGWLLFLTMVVCMTGGYDHWPLHEQKGVVLVWQYPGGEWIVVAFAYLAPYRPLPLFLRLLLTASPTLAASWWPTGSRRLSLKHCRHHHRPSQPPPMKALDGAVACKVLC